jgi:hypothetical protein
VSEFEQVDFSGTPLIAIHNPKMLCPVHGEVSSWVSFTSPNHNSPQYCVLCAWAAFDRLGVSVVTPIDASAE